MHARTVAQRGILELVTAPTSEPVTVDEVKAHARIEVSDDDALLATYIEAARVQCERFTGRAFITQTWKLTLDNWPGACGDDWWDGMREGALSQLQGEAVDIRKSPFIAMTTVQTVGEDGTLTTWDASNYYVASAPGGFARLVKKVGVTWPLIVQPVRQMGGIVITFTAGYGATAASVPMAIRQAIKMLVADWYEHREAVGEQGRKAQQEPPLGVTALLNQHVVAR